MFLPVVRHQHGATYTIVSGGFAHKCFANNLWLGIDTLAFKVNSLGLVIFSVSIGTMKNACLNAFAECLFKELEKDPVTTNVFCIHHGVADHDGDKNLVRLYPRYRSPFVAAKSD